MSSHVQRAPEEGIVAKREFHTHRDQELSHRLVPRAQELHKSRRRTWTHRIPEMRGRICICSSKHAGISWFGLVCGACYSWCLAPAPVPMVPAPVPAVTVGVAQGPVGLGEEGLVGETRVKDHG